MLSTYRDCLSSPHAKYLFATNLLGRLPQGMAPLAIALYLRSQHLGFGTVGVITALYGLSMAVGGPLLGRAVDKYGQVRVLCWSAIGSGAGFLSLAWSGDGGIGVAAPSAILAGLLSPPLEPSLRALWPSVLRDRRALGAAYALDASLQEVIFMAGPLLVVLVSSLADPTAGLVVTTAAMIAGTLGFVLPEPVQAWRAEPRHPDWAGPLRSGRFRRLLVSMLFVGGSLGALNISSVVYQEHVGNAGMSGILLGVNAAGALLGGLYYGARQWRISPPRQLTLLLAGMAVCYLPMALVPPPVVAGVLVFCAGLFLSPVLACAFTIIGELAPKGTATEAFAWMITAILAGNALGSSSAGWAGQHFGLWASFLVLGIAGIASTLVFAPLLQNTAQPRAGLEAAEETGL
ncbi:MFS transporter [Nonomuraea helvata]|uniref:MFS transporter n=1 Tax=Nonomuraea helvata TaxID=37484 RepID=A0ABV5SAB9_9ACTN